MSEAEVCVLSSRKSNLVLKENQIKPAPGCRREALGKQLQQPYNSEWSLALPASICCHCRAENPKRNHILLVILLGKQLDKGRKLTSDSSATLLCRDCLGEELSDFHDSLGQVQEPVTESESQDKSLARAQNNL